MKIRQRCTGLMSPAASRLLQGFNEFQKVSCGIKQLWTSDTVRIIILIETCELINQRSCWNKIIIFSDAVSNPSTGCKHNFIIDVF